MKCERAPRVALVAAGTTDLATLEEADLTIQLSGYKVGHFFSFE